MSVTHQELENFVEFANRSLSNGGAGLTLEELVADYREFDATCVQLRRAIEDMENGKSIPIFASDNPAW